MKILYGVDDNYADCTSRVDDSQSTILFPGGDVKRLNWLGVKDPCLGVLKHLVIFDDCGSFEKIPANDSFMLGKNSQGQWDLGAPDSKRIESPVHRLHRIHQTLAFSHGNLRDEFPEQLMAVEWIPPTAQVLELGANIGRNTCVIGRLLQDSSRLVAVECDVKNAEKLQYNRDQNGLEFSIVSKAISAQRLMQREWDTLPLLNATPPPGWQEIETISWPELRQQFSSLRFDTLVADCEGALYYILRDFPDFLDNIALILIENDFHDHSHKLFVDSVFQKKGFQVAFSESGGWGPCQPCFYQVWKKTE